jgi:gliding motility-associated-like protein
VIEPEFTFYVPNSFTPNGDGYNDEFFGKGENINSLEMWVYDRWGNAIFHGTDYNDHWDGTFHGHIVQEDVYVYVIKVKDFHNADHKYIGSVTVVR